MTSWTSTNKGPLARRQAFYDALAEALVVPAVAVERDRNRIDKRARGADYLGHYPGARLDQLASAMSPFVRLEVGHARVVPHAPMPLSSFVHDYLQSHGMLADYDDNRPQSVRCVHPFVTLLEKLDAMARRYDRDPLDANTFVRHYEDAAQIIRYVKKLPQIEMSVFELAQDMVATKDMRALPDADEPALLLADANKRQTIDRAFGKIAPMFWGPRIPLDEACTIVRSWLASQEWTP